MSKQCCGNIIIFQVFEFHCFPNVFPSLTNVARCVPCLVPSRSLITTAENFFKLNFRAGARERWEGQKIPRFSPSHQPSRCHTILDPCSIVKPLCRRAFKDDWRRVRCVPKWGIFWTDNIPATMLPHRSRCTTATAKFNSHARHCSTKTLHQLCCNN